MSSPIPVWRRSTSPRSDNKDDTPASWRARRTQSSSPTRPHERFERAKSLESGWRAGEERRVSEVRRAGEARTVAQRMADRGARDDEMNQLYSSIAFPSEPERVEMYRSLKKNTNHIITFLVEAVHDAGNNKIKNLPQAIKQNSENSHDNYDCKYKVHVNHLVTLAEQIVTSLETKARGIATTLNLLDTAIEERKKYSYCMYRIHAKDDANNEHAHFIDILEDVRTILSHHLDKKLVTAGPTTAKPLQRTTSTLGKRSRTNSPQRLAEGKKVSKTATSSSSSSSSLSSTPAPKPMHILRTGGLQSSSAQKGTKSAPTTKMSWATVAAVGA